MNLQLRSLRLKTAVFRYLNCNLQHGKLFMHICTLQLYQESSEIMGKQGYMMFMTYYNFINRLSRYIWRGRKGRMQSKDWLNGLIKKNKGCILIWSTDTVKQLNMTTSVHWLRKNLDCSLVCSRYKIGSPDAGRGLDPIWITSAWYHRVKVRWR